MFQARNIIIVGKRLFLVTRPISIYQPTANETIYPEVNISSGIINYSMVKKMASLWVYKE